MLTQLIRTYTTPCIFHLSNGLLLSTFFPVFNISKLNQIEIKTRFLRECEAFLWLWCLHFNHFTLSSDANHVAICIKLQCKMKQVASWFDANHMVFQRDFTSHFALTFVTSWMPKRCELLRNSTYLERRQCTFWIHQAFKSFCKIRRKDLTYFPLTVKSCGKVHSFGTKHLVINSFSGLENKQS